MGRDFQEEIGGLLKAPRAGSGVHMKLHFLVPPWECVALSRLEAGHGVRCTGHGTLVGTLAASEAGKAPTLTATERDGLCTRAPVWMGGPLCSEKGRLFVILTEIPHS